MTAEDLAWQALSDALDEVTPRCTDNPLFTADRLTNEEQEACGHMCASCPVFDLCDAYAKAAGVKAGFWAGRQRSAKRNRADEVTPPGGSDADH
ncbi:WhiB family transcriptional regulator [Microbacterium sp. GXF6406]